MPAIYHLYPTEATNVLQVHDLLSEYSNREILRAAQARIDEGFTNFVVDLSGIPYMNSVGLNFLITLQARCTDREGQLVVANASAKIIQLLEITKLRPLFHLTDSVEAAVQAIAEAS